MRIWAKATIGFVAIFGFGTVVGPVLIAAASAAYWADDVDDGAKWQETGRLLASYQHELAQIGYLNLSVILPDNGKECGYDSNKIFPNMDEDFGKIGTSIDFNYYNGYLALDRWKYNNIDEEWEQAVSQVIINDMNSFQIGFLRRCIEETTFSKMCMKQVAHYQNRVKRFDHGRPSIPYFGYGIEDQIICTYVDGVAARLGVPLENPKTTPSL
ncbi:hypothetical protein GRI97_16860 [Altererythrobacter xixiisoli]|uniref:Uncharacterized protein n=1 Tax=Croceibacterium xixiisoli TaxID=1476466 RepID=A0A6I4U214_9SPHN|nr:hypothetical protein [Croceibacterium xixiisoli]MXP00664.1 hypothetical protein [Croceibacterium xixiisoli]